LAEPVNAPREALVVAREHAEVRRGKAGDRFSGPEVIGVDRQRRCRRLGARGNGEEEQRRRGPG